MLRQINTLRGFLWWNSLLAERRCLLEEIAPIHLKIADVLFSLEDRTVTREYRLEVERHHALERRRPLFNERIAGVRQPAGDHVAGRDDAFSRQEYDDVTVGVRAPQEPDLNFATAAVQRHVAHQRGVRRCG